MTHCVILPILYHKLCNNSLRAYRNKHYSESFWITL